MESVSPRTLLTRFEAAEMLGVHPVTIDRFIRDGRLEAIRFAPHVVRIPLVSIARLIDSSERVPTHGRA
jgi:excisionase family DNA binding protein